MWRACISRSDCPSPVPRRTASGVVSRQANATLFLLRSLEVPHGHRRADKYIDEHGVSVTSREITAAVETELQAIERRVFEDVWISPARARTLAALATALAVTVTAATLRATGEAPAGVTGRGHWISLVALALFTLAASTSVFALVRRRFRWCCMAICVSALATVDGAGAFWWHHTAQTAFWLPAAALGSLASAALTAGWLGVCLAPLASSQPDMRAAGTGE
jgi:hypothetical protein